MSSCGTTSCWTRRSAGLVSGTGPDSDNIYFRCMCEGGETNSFLSPLHPNSPNMCWMSCLAVRSVRSADPPALFAHSTAAAGDLTAAGRASR